MNNKPSEIASADEERLKRRKKRAKTKKRKKVLIIIGVVVLAIAALAVALKPYIPEKAYTFVNEEILGNTTTTEPTTVTTTELTTTKPEGHYLPIEEFAFEQGKKGNLLGNVLAGGKAWHDDTYIYHIVDGDGIYRFYPADETYTRIYQSASYLANLNISDTHIYFTNESDKKLYSLKKGESTASAIADDVKTAYLYDSTVYYVTNAGALCVMNADGKGAKTLFATSSGEEVSLVGISLGRVYFTAKDSYGTLRFWTVDKDGKEEKVMFREVENAKEFISPVLEDGFLYYYTPNDDGSFDLHRQKFGSENVMHFVFSDSKWTY